MLASPIRAAASPTICAATKNQLRGCSRLPSRADFSSQLSVLLRISTMAHIMVPLGAEGSCHKSEHSLRVWRPSALKRSTLEELVGSAQACNAAAAGRVG